MKFKEKLFKSIKIDTTLWIGAILVSVLSVNIFYGKSEYIFSSVATEIAKEKAEATRKQLNIAKQEVNLLANKKLKLYSSDEVSKVYKRFKMIDYDMNKYNLVPLIQPQDIPKDMKSIKDTKARKKLFLELILPIVLKINNDLLKDRNELKAIIKDFNAKEGLSKIDKRIILNLSKQYNLDPDFEDMQKTLSILFIRADMIPVSLVLAQASIESGWGTSRFAAEGNALFGQWTYDASKGIVPKDRDANKNHFIQKFPSPYESVKSYMQNINTHRAYRQLRQLRAKLRRNKQPLSGLKLAQTLINYSEEREKYVTKLKGVIRYNDLERLNNYRLKVNRSF